MILPFPAITIARRALLLLALFIPVIGENTAASTVDAASILFNQGITLARQGNHEQALVLFRQAEAAGVNKPALFYNIGVSAYKAGRYPEAKDAFHRTAAFPRMTAIAYYNLGIIAEKEGDREAARSWLHRAVESATASDARTRELAAYALAKIGGKERASLWDKYVSLGLGYDDNVELSATDLLQASNQSDAFLDLFAFFRRPLHQAGTHSGSFLQSSFSYLKYEDISQYDTGSATVEYAWWQNWTFMQIEAGGGYQYILLDGDSYEQSPLLRLQLTVPVGTATALRFLQRSDYHDVLADEYDYLTGWRHRSQAEVMQNWPKIRAGISCAYEFNNRDDHDYSPTRTTLATNIRLQPLDRLTVAFILSWRDSNYDIALGQDRDEEQLDATAEVILSLTKGWETSLRYQYTDNDSNDTFYEYERNVITLFLSRFF